MGIVVLRELVNNPLNLCNGKILPSAVEVEYPDKVVPRCCLIRRRGFVRAGVLFNEPILQAPDSFVKNACRAGVSAEQTGCGYGRNGG